MASDWWNSLATTAQKFADQVTDTIVAQATAVENEIAQERERVRQQANPTASSSQSLPWESEDESKSILSEDLMQKILQLSHCDLNFTVAPKDELIQLLKFNFREKIPQVMSLLSLDHNLARLHAKISPKMDEEIFWRNYYARIYYLRYLSGIDSPSPNSFLDSLVFEEVVFIERSDDASPGKSPTLPHAVGTPAMSPPKAPMTSLQPVVSPITFPPSPPPNSASPNANGAGTGSSSDWDTCDDLKDSKPSSTSKGDSALHSKRLTNEIEIMKKDELERIKKREEEAAALAAEVAAALEEDTRQKKLLNNGKIASKNTKFDENLDMTDLDLLDIDEDFEDLGVGDEELEAQIAKELEDL